MKKEYDPKIAEVQVFIERVLGMLTREDEALRENVTRAQRRETELVGERLRMLRRCWRGYAERWA